MAMVNIEARELIDELKEKNRKLIDEVKDYSDKLRNTEDMAKQYEAIADETKKTLEEVKATKNKYKELAHKAMAGEVGKPTAQGRKFIVATKYRVGENAKIIVFQDTIQAIEEATDENGQNYTYIYMNNAGIAVEETIAEIMQKIKKAGAI